MVSYSLHHARSILFVGICITSVVNAAVPFALTWSDKSYGPDGPWHAVEVKIGSAEQEVCLYPGGVWQSYILLSSICSNTSISSYCYASTAGVFNNSASTSFDDTSIRLEINDATWGPLHFASATQTPIYGTAKWAMDYVDILGVSAPNVSLNVLDQGYQIYPDGTNYPLELGVLSLGAPDLEQTFSNSDGTSVNSTFVSSFIYTYGGGQATPSYSYGMHIGSPTFNIAGSLWLGGYDKSRVLGNVSSQPYIDATFPIKLRDISLGVVSGGSPWSSSSNLTGLLAAGNSSLSSNGITVLSSPGDPYLYLPQSTCDAIAAQLPVTYQSKYGLYFWNTSSKAYSDIVTSPSYLAFTFDKDNLNLSNITIKIPFNLLNLTLTRPLIDTPTPYFPCMGTDGTYALGRAFFQAAFVGVNWGSGTGNWFLAQAPGPNLQTTSTTVIQASDSSITGSDNSWENSWAGYWTELSSSTATATNATHTRSSSATATDTSLSTGAKAGIGVGCGVGALAAILLALWYFRRRRRAPKQVSSRAYRDARGGNDLPDLAQAQSRGGHSYRSRAPDHSIVSSASTVHKPPAELYTHQNEGPYEML
ncbi:uncharacterized protein BP01DRAFT_357430 [Aspergillus saccharolyticus JOP 1030-1]|uniref:Peptidase A1 domain-containing protein n=1 Tax=Aspergillus saccharolyticus JOP 1030-1 TaxID=1450539 RepID=A0A318ZBC6_9EURO|nr:hypothetical protein BP01DRAFT_357430 [Aspergillus saccharolyticus JOP 1030-1]PYH44751.1 hypothetical protein BP01DRAFT_357430 [Aspergillus saccharolyticus JOP 1030-1]